MATPPPTEAIGTIVGIQSQRVIVELSTGEQVMCRSVKRLHRPLGFMTVPYGRRVKIRYTKGIDRSPLLVEVFPSGFPK